MATIGLDKLYYAKITEAEDGEETYDTPVILAKAISAELSVELAEATLYADDGASEVVKDFKSGKLTLGVDDIGITAAQDLTGAAADDNGVLISAGENIAPPVAKVPVFLAVPRHFRHPCRQSADQGRFHHLSNAQHRGHGHAPQQTGHQGNASVEGGGFRGCRGRYVRNHHRLVRAGVRANLHRSTGR